MNYLSNYAWQEDDQLAEMEPWEERELQDMLRHQGCNLIDIFGWS